MTWDHIVSWALLILAILVGFGVLAVSLTTIEVAVLVILSNQAWERRG